MHYSARTFLFHSRVTLSYHTLQPALLIISFMMLRYLTLPKVVAILLALGVGITHQADSGLTAVDIHPVYYKMVHIPLKLKVLKVLASQLFFIIII